MARKENQPPENLLQGYYKTAFTYLQTKLNTMGEAETFSVNPLIGPEFLLDDYYVHFSTTESNDIAVKFGLEYRDFINKVAAIFQRDEPRIIISVAKHRSSPIDRYVLSHDGTLVMLQERNIEDIFLHWTKIPQNEFTARSTLVGQAITALTRQKIKSQKN